MKYFLLVFLTGVIVATAADVHGQEQSSSKNTLFAEGFSAGTYYTINYDRIFASNKKLNWSFRVGAGVLPDKISLPLGLTAFTSAEKHHLEYSLTIIPFVDHYGDLFSGQNLSDKKLYIFPALGYRYQRTTGGFFARIAAGPYVLLDPPSDDFWKMDGKFSAGVSLGTGWSF